MTSSKEQGGRKRIGQSSFVVKVLTSNNAEKQTPEAKEEKDGQRPRRQSERGVGSGLLRDICRRCLVPGPNESCSSRSGLALFCRWRVLGG